METVQLFVTCMAENLLPDVLQKMVGLLERLGVRCGFPEDQTCCGQPFFNSGFQSEGREMARDGCGPSPTPKGPSWPPQAPVSSSSSTGTRRCFPRDRRSGHWQSGRLHASGSSASSSSMT